MVGTHDLAAIKRGLRHRPPGGRRWPSRDGPMDHPMVREPPLVSPRPVAIRLPLPRPQEDPAWRRPCLPEVAELFGLCHQGRPSELVRHRRAGAQRGLGTRHPGEVHCESALAADLERVGSTAEEDHLGRPALGRAHSDAALRGMDQVGGYHPRDQQRPVAGVYRPPISDRGHGGTTACHQLLRLQCIRTSRPHCRRRAANRYPALWPESG